MTMVKIKSNQSSLAASSQGGTQGCLHPAKVMFAFLVNTALYCFLSLQHTQVSHIWLPRQKTVQV